MSVALSAMNRFRFLSCLILYSRGLDLPVKKASLAFWTASCSRDILESQSRLWKNSQTKVKCRIGDRLKWKTEKCHSNSVQHAYFAMTIILRNIYCTLLKRLHIYDFAYIRYSYEIYFKDFNVMPLIFDSWCPGVYSIIAIVYKFMKVLLYSSNIVPILYVLCRSYLVKKILNSLCSMHSTWSEVITREQNLALSPKCILG